MIRHRVWLDIHNKYTETTDFFVYFNFKHNSDNRHNKTLSYIYTGTLKTWERKARDHEKCGGEKAGLEKRVTKFCMGGKSRTTVCGTRTG